jgi:hypothetical protein
VPKLSTKLIPIAVLVLGATVAFTQSNSAQPANPQSATVQSVAKSTKPAPATPIDAKKAELGGNTWDPGWDHLIEQDIPLEMLGSEVPRDVRKFCPNFYRMSDTDKRVFWAYFFQALAGAEAGLEPTTNVRHPQMAKKDTVTREPVHSEGLLQLTFEDERIYGCDFDWEHDRQLPPHDPDRTILQPKNNLACGVRILYNQIINQHRPLLTKHSYWSTLQPGTIAYRVFAKEMTNPPAACAKPARPEHLKGVTTADVQQKANQSSANQTSEEASAQ